MALAIGTRSAIQTGAGVSSISWTHTVTSGATGGAVICFGYFCGVTNAPTWNGSNMTLLGSQISDATGDVAFIYWIANPTTGTVSITFTNANAAYPIARSIDVTGGDTTDIFRNASAQASGNSNALASGTVTSATGDICISIGGQDPAGTITETAGWSDTTTTNGGEKGVMGEVAGAATVAASYSSTSSQPWILLAASFKAAAAAGLVVNPLSGRGGAAAQPLVN